MNLIYIDETGKTLEGSRQKTRDIFPKSNEIIAFANGFDTAIESVNKDIDRLMMVAELYGAGYTLALNNLKKMINNKEVCNEKNK